MPKKTMRNEPQQFRSKRRVASILSAAASLFSENGYDSTSTNAIASRADTAIGSLYHYFPDKRAILAKLTEMYEQQLNALFDATDDRRSIHSLEAMSNHMVEKLAGFYHKTPGFRGVFQQNTANTDVRWAADEMRRVVAERVAKEIKVRVRGMDEAKARHAALILTTAWQSLLAMYIDEKGDPVDAVLVEIKRLSLAYLRDFLKEHRPSPRSLNK
jgi:AcrR family transcriptional regulator